MAYPDLCYSSISYNVAPSVKRTPYHTRNSRQRMLLVNRDDVFDVSARVTSTVLGEFETFITDEINNGADTFEGTYYDGDVERTGTLLIPNGEYEVSYVAPDIWDLSFTFEVQERDMTDSQNIYEVVNEYDGFDELSEVLSALAITVNENTLEP